MTFTLLMTCVGGELAPQLIRSLKASSRHDVKVIGVDAGEAANGRYFADAFHVVPMGTSPEYVEKIAALVERHGVDLVLPTSDEEALALSRGRELIEQSGCQLACADAETLAIVSDKARCYEYLAELGLPVPNWRRVDDIATLPDVVRQFAREHGDIVVKPAAERGGRGICVIRQDVTGAAPYQGGREFHMDLDTFLTDFAAGFADQAPAVVMERLHEPVHDLDMLAWKGTAIRLVARRRRDSALPNEGHVVVNQPDLLELGRRLIAALDLTWLYDCDIMYDQSGNPGILEINPRPSGSIATTITAGVPLLDDMISLAKGEAVPEIDDPTGRMVVPYKALTMIAS